MPKFSIIIPTFNSKNFIRSCLISIFSQDYRDFEVIVVDNGSGDDTVDLAKHGYPEVILIENRRNLGACKARNQGIKASCGKWVLTLDCDTILEKDSLLNISKTIDTLGFGIGMLQPKILKSDKKTIYSCGIYLSWSRKFYDIGKDKKDTGQFDESKYVFGACSACAIYNRRMLEDIKEDKGYFDGQFFFLVEDVDLAWRAQKRGWKALFCPDAVCYHYGNSSGTSKKIRQYLCFRNRYYSIMKNEGFKNYSKRFLPLLFYDLPRLLYLFLSNSYIRETNKRHSVDIRS